MAKIKSFLILLLVLCILGIGSVARSQQISLGEIRTTSKEDLVLAVLSENEISKRYDLYLGNSIDAVLPLEITKNNEFMGWMQSLFTQEAGWSHIETTYISQLEENFSETELRELLELVKQPLIKKLVQTEIEAYSSSAEERRRLLSKLWENYNNGMFNPPIEVSP